MNGLLYALVVLILFVVIAVMYWIKNKRILESIFLLSGGIFVAGSFYIWPASMWRSIAIGLLCIGLICFSIFAILLVKKMKQK